MISNDEETFSEEEAIKLASRLRIYIVRSRILTCVPRVGLYAAGVLLYEGRGDRGSGSQSRAVIAGGIDRAERQKIIPANEDPGGLLGVVRIKDQ